MTWYGLMLLEDHVGKAEFGTCVGDMDGVAVGGVGTVGAIVTPGETGALVGTCEGLGVGRAVVGKRVGKYVGVNDGVLVTCFAFMMF